jgi:Carboxypeptidase regulatory-like domain
MKNWRHFLGSCALLFAYAVSLQSQTALTSLRGTVIDPSGAAVPNAQVALDNKATGAHMTRATDSNGEYSFLQIPPGRYTVTATVAGFGTQTKEAELLVNQPATIDFALSVQASKTTVEVSTEAQTINQTDASIGNSVSNTTVEALPMEGRNVPDLLSLQPGVLYLGQQFNNISSSTRDTDSRSGAVAGARSDQSNVTLDGIDDNDQRQGYAFTGVLRSTLDSLQEFRVTTTDANADTGRSSGAQVVLVTKSGTNQFHGSAYEYNRNAAAEANEFFNKTAELQAGLPNKPPALVRNTFGGSFGGPIKHDKLFFFLNYEGQRTSENRQVLQVVPTQSFRDGNVKYLDKAGNVVTLCSAISISANKCPNASPKDDLGAMDPKCSGNGTCPWGPGADPNSLATFQAYPLPNTSFGDGLNTGGFTFSAPNPISLNTYIAKLDYEMSSHSHFFIRGIQQGDRISGSPEFPGQPPSSQITDTSKGLAAGHLWTIGQNLINNARYGYIRQGLNVTGAGTASYSDFAGLSPLTAENRSTLLNVPVHNFVDDVNWIKGKHTLQFGVNWRIIHNNTFSNAVSFASAASGANNISQAAIAGTGQSMDPAAFGYPGVGGGFSTSYDNAITDITGLLSAINVNNNYKVSKDGTQATLLPLATLIPRQFKANEFEWYVQDSYRFKPNLTVTLGVRHSLLQTPYEVNGQQVAPTINLGEWFNNRALAAKQGQGNQPEFAFAPSGQGRGGKPYWPMNKDNFAPRMSVAYSPGFQDGFLKRLFGGPGKTSIRAGAGVYYDHFGEGIVDGFSQFGSFGLTSTQSAPSNILTPDDAPRYTSRTSVPLNVLIPPSPSVSYPATPSNDPLGTGFTANSNGINGNLKTPYSITMDFSVQRQLPGGFTFEGAYVGRRGRHLLQQLDLAAATDLVDPKSGMDYFTAATLMTKFALAHGEDSTAVIAPIPYFENLFPTAAAGGFSATQNIYTGSGGSANCPSGYRWANRPGREIGAPFRLGLLMTQLANGGGSPTCFGLPPVPFWDPQFASLMAWSSIGVSSYNAAQFIVRHPMSHGLQMDFSYTLGKSLDMGSDAERTNSLGTTSTTVSGLGTTIHSFIEVPWNPRLNYAPSDFDIRHVITTTWVYDLPFGQGKWLGSKAGTGLNAIIGGWQLSGLGRWTSALPFSVVDSHGFTNNFLLQDFLVKTGPVQSGLFHDPTSGAPIAFPNPGAVVAGAFSVGSPATLTPLRFAFPGEAGSRNAFRGQGFFGIDASLAKTWKVYERMSLKFAWEVFNATNSVRFDTNSIDNGSDDGGFGFYSSTLTKARVQQFSLRLTF